MQITYELTQKDIYEAIVANRNRRPRYKWLLRLEVLVGYLLAVPVLWVWFTDPEMREHSSLIPLFLLIVFLTYVKWGAPLCAARALYRKRPSVQGVKKMSLDAAGLHIVGNGWVSDVEWRSLVLWWESGNYFLLYFSPTVFDCVPKRAMTPEDMVEFRSLLAEHVKSG